MSAALGTIVDTTALLKVIAGSLAAGIGVSAAFSFAILGATRSADLRRDGRQAAAGVFAVFAALALAVCAGAIALGFYVMISK